MISSIHPQLARDNWMSILPLCEGREQLIIVRRLCRVAHAAFHWYNQTHPIKMVIRSDKVDQMQIAPQNLHLTINFGDSAKTIPHGRFFPINISNVTIISEDPVFAGKEVPAVFPTTLISRMQKVVSFSLQAIPPWYLPANLFFASLETLPHPLRSSQLIHLRHLDLNHHVAPRGVLQLLQSSDRFEFLRFSSCTLADAHFIEIGRQGELRSLYLKGKNPLNYDKLLENNLARSPHLKEFCPSRSISREQLITFLRQHPQISTLYLSELPEEIIDDSLVDAIASLSELQVIHFPIGAAFTDTGLLSLCQSRSCNNLREFSLPAPSQVTLRGTKAALQLIGPKLESLDLSGMSMDDVCVEMFGTFTQLKVLLLAYTKGYSEKTLVDTLGKLSQLEKISLHQIELSDKKPGDRLLAALGKNCKHLVELKIYADSLFSSYTLAGFQGLINQLSRLKYLSSFSPTSISVGRIRETLQQNHPHINFMLYSARHSPRFP